MRGPRKTRERVRMRKRGNREGERGRKKIK